MDGGENPWFTLGHQTLQFAYHDDLAGPPHGSSVTCSMRPGGTMRPLHPRSRATFLFVSGRSAPARRVPSPAQGRPCSSHDLHEEAARRSVRGARSRDARRRGADAERSFECRVRRARQGRSSAGGRRGARPSPSSRTAYVMRDLFVAPPRDRKSARSGGSAPSAGWRRCGPCARSRVVLAVLRGAHVPRVPDARRRSGSCQPRCRHHQAGHGGGAGGARRRRRSSTFRSRARRAIRSATADRPRPRRRISVRGRGSASSPSRTLSFAKPRAAAFERFGTARGSANRGPEPAAVLDRSRLAVPSLTPRVGYRELERERPELPQRARTAGAGRLASWPRDDARSDARARLQLERRVPGNRRAASEQHAAREHARPGDRHVLAMLDLGCGGRRRADRGHAALLGDGRARGREGGGRAAAAAAAAADPRCEDGGFAASTTAPRAASTRSSARSAGPKSETPASARSSRQ